MDTPLYVGIDLGTTNSAAAVFDGERVSVIRNAQGATVTPSVVRIDKQGRVMVGSRARRFVDQDSENTASEFKRLMGTGTAIEFPAHGSSKKPEELSAEVLKALRQDITDQLGVQIDRASGERRSLVLRRTEGTVLRHEVVIERVVAKQEVHHAVRDGEIPVRPHLKHVRGELRAARAARADVDDDDLLATSAPIDDA